MCVLAFAWKMDPDWPLVLAGNRDERHDRPSAPLHRWAEDPRIVAGQDLTAGGAWLGVSERGLLVTVTNVVAEGEHEEGRPSRGWLVRDLLLGRGDYAAPTPAMLDAFNPLNLLVFDRDEARFWSNRPAPEVRALAAGVYGLSNAGLDQRGPRTDRLMAGLAAWMAEGSGRIEEPARLLADSSIPDAGRGDDRENRPIFLRNPTWGTRCSTVVRVSRDGRGEILERRYDAEGGEIGDSRFDFAWDARG